MSRLGGNVGDCKTAPWQRQEPPCPPESRWQGVFSLPSESEHGQQDLNPVSITDVRVRFPPRLLLTKQGLTSMIHSPCFIDNFHFSGNTVAELILCWACIEKRKALGYLLRKGQIVYARGMLRSRKTLPTTDRELALIAAAAIIGLSKTPKKGNKIPAAIGIPMTLYTKARKKFWRIIRMTRRLS
jgi:hypothetical protein